MLLVCALTPNGALQPTLDPGAAPVIASAAPASGAAELGCQADSYALRQLLVLGVLAVTIRFVPDAKVGLIAASTTYLAWSLGSRAIIARHHKYRNGPFEAPKVVGGLGRVWKESAFL